VFTPGVARGSAGLGARLRLPRLGRLWPAGGRSAVIWPRVGAAPVPAAVPDPGVPQLPPGTVAVAERTRGYLIWSGSMESLRQRAQADGGLPGPGNQALALWSSEPRALDDGSYVLALTIAPGAARRLAGRRDTGLWVNADDLGQVAVLDVTARAGASRTQADTFGILGRTLRDLAAGHPAAWPPPHPDSAMPPARAPAAASTYHATATQRLRPRRALPRSQTAPPTPITAAPATGISFRSPPDQARAAWPQVVFDGRYVLETASRDGSHFERRKLPFEVSERTFFVDLHSTPYSLLAAAQADSGSYRPLSTGQAAAEILQNERYLQAVQRHGDDLEVVLFGGQALHLAAQVATGLGRPVWASDGPAIVGPTPLGHRIGLRQRGPREPRWHRVGPPGPIRSVTAPAGGPGRPEPAPGSSSGGPDMPPPATAPTPGQSQQPGQRTQREQQHSGQRQAVVHALLQDPALGLLHRFRAQPAGLDAVGDLSPDQLTRLGEALAGMPDAGLRSVLAEAGLDPEEIDWALAWVGDARASAGWADRALRSLTGNPDFALNRHEKPQLIRLLAGAGASLRELASALYVVRFSEDPELEALEQAGILDLLDSVIPGDGAHRGFLDGLRGYLRDKQEQEFQNVEPPAAFNFGVISADSAHLSDPRTLTPEQISRITEVLTPAADDPAPHDRSIKLLGNLSDPELFRAGWGLSGLHGAIYSTEAGEDGQPRKPALASLEKVWAWTLREAITLVQNAGTLSGITLPALIAPVPDQPATMTQTASQPGHLPDQLPEGAEDFAADLHRALLADIAAHKERAEQMIAAHAWPEHRFDMAHIRAILNEAKKWTDRGFGHIATGPELDQIKLHDALEYRLAQIGSMSVERKLDEARRTLGHLPFIDSNSAKVLRRYKESGLFSPDDESEIMAVVYDHLLQDKATVGTLLRIDATWSGGAVYETKEILVDVHRDGDPEKDRQKLWKIFQTLIHEYLHLVAHPEWVRFVMAQKGLLYYVLGESSMDVLAGIVWDLVATSLGDEGLRQTIEGKFFGPDPLPSTEMPYFADEQYTTYHLFIALFSVAGIYTPFTGPLLGEWQKITDAVTAVTGLKPVLPPDGVVAA